MSIHLFIPKTFLNTTYYKGLLLMNILEELIVSNLVDGKNLKNSYLKM